MRDDAAQAAGPFPLAKGSRLRHDKLIDFIERDSDAGDRGRWFFQNGPQRVFVELESTPHIARLTPDEKVQTHNGQRFEPNQALVDEDGMLYLASHTQVARVHTQDMLQALDWIEARGWIPKETGAAELPLRFGFVRHPAPEV